MLDTSWVSRFAINGTGMSWSIPGSRLYGYRDTILFDAYRATAPGMAADQDARAPEVSAREFPTVVRIATGRDRAAGSAARRPPTESLTCSRSIRRTDNV